MSSTRRPLRSAADAKVIMLKSVDDDPLAKAVSKAKFSHQHARPGDHLHVSDLLSKCIRLKSIAKREQATLPSKLLSVSDMLAFRMGEAVHDVLKERAAEGSPDRVWGKWSCKCKNLQVNDPCTYADVDHTVVCEYCGESAKNYNEVTLRNDRLMIVGHPDLLFQMPKTGAIYVTELKSMNHEQWKTLERALPDHVIQVFFYWYLLKEAGYSLVDHVSIMYASKQYVYGELPLKTFVIPVKDIDRRLAPYLEQAEAYAKALKGEDHPPRVYCASKDSPDARKCPLSSICFGEKKNAGKVVSYSEALEDAGAARARRTSTSSVKAPAGRLIRKSLRR